MLTLFLSFYLFIFLSCWALLLPVTFLSFYLVGACYLFIFLPCWGLVIGTRGRVIPLKGHFFLYLS